MKNPVIAIVISGCTLALTSCATTNNLLHPTHQPIDHSTINVSIQGGQITADKQLQNYNPINFQIQDGDCKDIQVTTNNSNSTTLQTCFVNNALYLDAGRFTYKHQGTIRFYNMPLWQQGYTYPNISTNGPTHLTNSTVSIKLISTATE